MRQLHALLFIAIITSSSLLSSTALAANPILTFETNRGNFIVELYPEKAPKTVANFIRYVNAGFYKDTIFHRVISGFMIQGGGFTTAMVEKETQAPVENEANNGMVNDVGTMAMARTSDPNSATAQFFINLGNNQTLNYQGDDAQLIGYCVFGRVLKGMDVVRDIGVTPTGNLGPFSDVPKSAVVVYQVKLNN
jgi:peptidyl-prolyl cis-trans isomerase A (cyclophilin A)